MLNKAPFLRSRESVARSHSIIDPEDVFDVDSKVGHGLDQGTEEISDLAAARSLRREDPRQVVAGEIGGTERAARLVSPWLIASITASSLAMLSLGAIVFSFCPEISGGPRGASRRASR